MNITVYFLVFSSATLVLCQTTRENNVYKVYDTIVNPYNFKSIINPGYVPCRNASLLVIYVHSSPENLKNRMSIRDTWGSRSLFPNMVLLFMTGRSERERMNELLILESSIYHDIVQDDFIDTYHNLTYKSMMAMKWIDKYCRDIKFILKADDDMLVNTFNLIRHISSLDNNTRNNESMNGALWCYLNSKMSVIRQPKSKWYLSREEFKDDVFEKYCAGAAFVLSGDLAGKLYQASQLVKFFWIDDFFLTGLATRAVKGGVNQIAINSLFVLNSLETEEKMMSRRARWITFAHLGRRDGVDRLYKIWQGILNLNS